MGRVGAVTFSRRLRQCLRLSAEGYTQKEIGFILGISRRTVIAHLSRARMLTGAHSTTHLVLICSKLGLLDDVEIDRSRKIEDVKIARARIMAEIQEIARDAEIDRSCEPEDKRDERARIMAEIQGFAGDSESE